MALPKTYQRMHGKQTPPVAYLKSYRLVSKQVPPERVRLQAMLAHASLLECADDGLESLGVNIKRNHVHWTHPRTMNPAHRQPSSFTREQFWQHVDQCYRIAYTDDDSLTGSILMFGCVAKERHAKAWSAQHRDEHHHCATYCSMQHYWVKVAKISRDRFGVYMNAVAHKGYVEMWRYLREATPKKPLAELDAELYLSPLHPRGQELTELLEINAKSVACRAGHASALGVLGGQRKRPRVDSVFELVKKHRIKKLAEMEIIGHREAGEGSSAVAELCTRTGHKMQQLIDNANRVIDAPKLLEESGLTLMDKLRRGAAHLDCECGGAWIDGAVDVLDRNKITPQCFAKAILRALELGAKRGVSVGIVGKAGCGKSMLVEPLEKVFVTGAKPQKNSSAPLASSVGVDILLWQDYKHHEATLSFTDLLSYLVGESVDVRVLGEKNVKVRNKAPLIYSGRKPISSDFADADERSEYDEMMMERFTIFSFNTPIPKTQRKANHPHCGKCCAAFYLKYGIGTASPAAAATNPPSGSGQTISPNSGLAQQLLLLQQLHSTGALDAQEFGAAKAKLLV